MKLSLRQKVWPGPVVPRARTLGDVVVLPNFETTFELQERDIEEFQGRVRQIFWENGLLTKYQKERNHYLNQGGLYVSTQTGLVFDGFGNSGHGPESLKEFYLRFKGRENDNFYVSKNHALFSFLENPFGHNVGLWISTPILGFPRSSNPWFNRNSAAYVME